jgi:hypothetical protein
MSDLRDSWPHQPGFDDAGWTAYPDGLEQSCLYIDVTDRRRRADRNLCAGSDLPTGTGLLCAAQRLDASRRADLNLTVTHTLLVAAHFKQPAYLRISARPASTTFNRSNDLAYVDIITSLFRASCGSLSAAAHADQHLFLAESFKEGFKTGVLTQVVEIRINPQEDAWIRTVVDSLLNPLKRFRMFIQSHIDQGNIKG